MSFLSIAMIAFGVLVALFVVGFVVVAVLATRAAKAAHDPTMDPGAKEVDEEDRAFVETLCAEATRAGTATAPAPSADREADHARLADALARASGDSAAMREAASMAGALLAADANDAHAWAALAEAVLRACYAHDDIYWRGGLAKAEPFVDRALAIAPGDSDICALKGQFRILRGFVDEAEARVASLDGWRACMVRSLVARVRRRMATATEERQRLRETSVAELERAARLAPPARRAGMLNSLAHALEEIDRFDDALRAYDEALAANPEHAWAWHNRARLLYRQKRIADALASSDRALAIGEFPAARTLNATIRAELG